MAESIGCEVGALCEVANPLEGCWMGCNEGPGAETPSRVETVVNGLKVTFLCARVAEERDVGARFEF
jgi:hypothetical protein